MVETKVVELAVLMVGLWVDVMVEMMAVEKDFHWAVLLVCE
jgi:hypothetical protein